MPPKGGKFKVIGTKKFKLSELPVDNLVNLAKQMNKSIRAAHVVHSKAIIAQVKRDEKENLAKVKAMLTQKLKDSLILTAKRKKAQLIADIMRNKQHIPKGSGMPAQPKKKQEDPPEVDMSAETTDEEQEEEEEKPKPKYITKRIGGKLRRIPVAKLDEAAAKKKEAKLGTKENPIKKTKPNVPVKSSVPEPPFDCDKCDKKSYTARCAKCMRKDLAVAEKAEEEKKPKALPKATEEEKQIAKIGSQRIRGSLAARFGAKAEKTEQAKKKPEPAKAGDSLKELKQELKAKGVPKVALKFIKTVEQAKEKLAELEEEEPEDEKVKISEKVLQQIPMKNQAKIKKLIVKVLPRDEFTLQDQVEYFNDLKEMGENWDMSSIPRQRYDKFDGDEKLLFELLYPAIFDKKAKKQRADAKRAERKAKGE